MILNHIILAIVWILYCVLHSLLAGIRFKKQVASWLGKNYKYYRIFYTVFAFIGLVAILWFQFSISSPFIFQPVLALTIPSLILAITGLLIMLSCIRKYFFSLSGLKTLFYENTESELMINGLHRFVRHPLYLGTFMFLWGVFFTFPLLSFLIACLIITVYTVFALRFEEAKLLLEFGESYRNYQEKVPALIPFTKLKSGNKDLPS